MGHQSWAVTGRTTPTEIKPVLRLEELVDEDYIRSLCRENNATQENVEALKQKIEQLNAEIEAFQEQLPEHGSSSIHRILSRRGKSIPDMFADHVRQRTQSDWRYWVYTSIMGHF